MGQTKVNCKSNEITAIPALLEMLDISGCIITIDANAYAPFALYLSVKKITETEEKKYEKYALNNFEVVLSIIDFGL